MMQTYRLGELLICRGIISEQQLSDALSYQKHHKVNLGQALKAMGFASAFQIRFALFKQHWLRSVATMISIFVAPISQCYGETNIEELPEYSYTQVAQTPCPAQAFNTYESTQFSSEDINAMEVASTAIWYLSQGGLDTQALTDLPVQLSLNTKNFEDGFSVNMSVKF